ncbi:hypothetical protein PG623_07785 [Riemerella anatipestifer]|nr:hypothetical protein [Riemerella anatipestifer]
MNYELVTLVFVFIVLIIIFGFFGIVLFFITKYIRNKFNLDNKFFKDRNLKLTVLSIVILLSVYESYTAVYPTDDFYYSEFEYVTLEKVPKSAKIIFKNSSYPDFHGDYSSKSTIELSQNDFNNLIHKIETEKKLEKLPPQNKNEIATFQRKIKGESDRYLYITFLRDGKTILISVDFT